MHIYINNCDLHESLSPHPVNFPPSAPGCQLFLAVNINSSIYCMASSVDGPIGLGY